MGLPALGIVSMIGSAFIGGLVGLLAGWLARFNFCLWALAFTLLF
jgi:hypothetical protein